METKKVIKYGNSKVLRVQNFEEGKQLFILTEEEYVALRSNQVTGQ